MNEVINNELSFDFEPRKTIKGYPELHWTGKRPYRSTVYYPAQLKEVYGESKDNWLNKIFWGDNLQVMSHLLKDYRGKIDLIYIDPPFDSKADYKKKIKLKGKSIYNDNNTFEEKQYGDLWTNDEYLQFMFERLTILKELMSEKGSIYLHCDWHKSHQLRMIMDEIFGANHYKNTIIWQYQGSWVEPKNKYPCRNQEILFYTKSTDYTFNLTYDDEYVEKGVFTRWSKYIVDGKIYGKNYPTTDGKFTPYYNAFVKEYGREPKDDDVIVEFNGPQAGSVWYMSTVNPISPENKGYPTQKPEKVLERIIQASSNPGDIVFDCFMGSGTTQAVAMKLGRRFIGADINLGAIQTTTKRLIGVAEELTAQIGNDDKYTGFEVYNVNNYDMFRNPLEARELILKALEVQAFESSNVYDGEKDGRMIKVMPVNRIATKADLKALISNLPYKSFERKKDEDPNAVVLKLTLVCMGHESNLAGYLKQELGDYNVDIDVVDILHDRADLQFKRDAEAEVAIDDGYLVIENFYPLNLMQKLSMERETVEEWRQLVETIMIDFNYDGAVMQPALIDIPEKNELVKGRYKIPEDAGTIRVKITDVLSESLEVEVYNG